MSEESKTPEEERHEARAKLVEEVEKTYVGEYAKPLGAFFKSNSKKITDLQEKVGELIAEAGTHAREAAAIWDATVTDLTFPVEGGKVVPWTMRLSTEELWLGVGNNEIVVVDYSGTKPKTCWFATPDKQDGKRECYLCHRRVFLPDSDAEVAMIPDDPKELAAALKAAEG